MNWSPRYQCRADSQVFDADSITGRGKASHGQLLSLGLHGRGRPGELVMEHKLWSDLLEGL